jgi:hypothetical protein
MRLRCSRSARRTLERRLEESCMVTHFVVARRRPRCLSFTFAPLIEDEPILCWVGMERKGLRSEGWLDRHCEGLPCFASIRGSVMLCARGKNESLSDTSALKAQSYQRVSYIAVIKRMFNDEHSFSLRDASQAPCLAFVIRDMQIQSNSVVIKEHLSRHETLANVALYTYD